MKDEPILDYDFEPHQRARMIYWDQNESNYIIVEILESQFINNSKWYLVSATKTILDETTIEYQDIRQENYPNMNENYAVFLVEPDELEPAFRSLQLVVDNSTGDN